MNQMVTKIQSVITNPSLKLYQSSFNKVNHSSLMMIRDQQKDFIIVHGEGELYQDLIGEEIADQLKKCPTNHANRLVLNQYFDYTKPQAFGEKISTIGLGDRLGLASPGHISTVRNRTIKPVLAQQSIRELELTNRKIEDVIDAASYAVFKEGYKDGFGADGDHLKLEVDIKKAIDAGFSMLTLDCSDQIDNSITHLSDEERLAKFNQLDPTIKNYYQEKYLGQTFTVQESTISFDQNTLTYNVLLYREAIQYMVHIYQTYLAPQGRAIDFEISIDETETITTPESHFFVANELINQKVDVTSLAPRFIGEFQKGIDYIGDVNKFKADFREHALIAKHFNYKMSVHSGSDKFSIFPIVAELTDGLFHLKTAGTNWLEAIRLIGIQDPTLFREMFTYALDQFEVARAYYHITPSLDKIKPLDQVSDQDLPTYLDDDNARQVWHITYGILLTAQTKDGAPLFRERFFNTLVKYEADYHRLLINHIGRHLDLLAIESN